MSLKIFPAGWIDGRGCTASTEPIRAHAARINRLAGPCFAWIVKFTEEIAEKFAVKLAAKVSRGKVGRAGKSGHCMPPGTGRNENSRKTGGAPVDPPWRLNSTFFRISIASS